MLRTRGGTERRLSGKFEPVTSALAFGFVDPAREATDARLMADAESPAPSLVTAREQATWTDPESGYRRRAVSPPAQELRGEMVEVRIPAGATVSFDASPVAGLEHHLWMLEGALTLDVEGTSHRVRAGDCLRYVLAGPTRFRATGKRAARYVIAMVRP